MHKSLTYKPFVWWRKEVSAKFFLEGCHTAVAARGKFFDGDVAEDVAVDELFEVFAGHIDV